MPTPTAARRIAIACAAWPRSSAGCGTPRPFDLIIANILAGPLRVLAGDVASRCGAAAIVVLSGILNPEAPAVIAAYAAHGFALGPAPPDRRAGRR